MTFASRILPLILTAFIMLGASTAYACGSNLPAGVEGQIIFNESSNAPQYCDGTNWIAMVGADPYQCPQGQVSCGGRPDQRVAFSAVAMSAGSSVSAVDSFCESQAASAGLKGNYLAWRSNATTSPAQRFEKSQVPYVDTLGRTIADDWDDLTDGTLQVSISADEFAVTAGAFQNVTTYTNPDGTFSGGSCNTTDLIAGRRSGTDATWTQFASSPCTSGTRVYCFEQATTLTEIVPDGLIGHWRLDEASGTIAFDSSGNGRHATYEKNKSGWDRRGPVNRAVETDESYNVTVTDPAFDNLSAFSLCYWIKYKDYGSGSTGHNPITKPNAFQIRGYRTGITNNFRKNGWNTVDLNINPLGYRYQDTDWRHHCITFDETSAPDASKIYTNGVETYSGTSGAGTSQDDSGTEIRFGVGSFQHIYFDDLRFYDRAIIPEEVEKIYAAKDGIRYNQNFRTPEYFDGNNFTAMKGVFPEPSTNATPEIVEGVTFDGSTYLRQTSLGGSDVTEVSGSLWFKRNVSNVGISQTIVHYRNAGGQYFRIRFNTSNQLVIDGQETGTGNFTTLLSSSSTFSDGDWHHVMFSVNTTDRGLDNLYVDGVDDASSTGATIPAFGGGDQMSIGIFGTSNEPLFASLADVWLDFDNRIDFSIQANRENFYSANNTPVNLGSDGSGPTGSSPEVYLGGDFASWPNNKGTFSGFTENGTLTTTASNGGLIGHWKFDETEGAIATDSSGNGNDATIESPVYSELEEVTVNGPQGPAVDFKRQRAGFNVPHDNSLNATDVTITGWMKFNFDNSVNRLVTKNGDYQLETRPSTNRFYLKKEGGANAQFDYTGTIVEDQWYHVAGTFDDSADTVKFYIDGTPIGTVTGYTDSFNQGTQDVLISENGPRHADAIDDVRIYNRVLSDAEIAQIYQIGTPINPSTALPLGCPNIGDVCDDGTVYAGISPDGSVEMYTTVDNAPTFLPWNNGNTSDNTTTGATDINTGYANTAAIIKTDSDSVTTGVQPHQAAQYCWDLNEGNTDDWYLPAQEELRVLNNGRQAIPNLNELVVNDGSKYWWASTETSQTQARQQRMYDPYAQTSDKRRTAYTRCVRKGPAPRCATPYGLEGQMFYNETHDVVQYCDGARWIAIGKDG